MPLHASLAIEGALTGALAVEGQLTAAITLYDPLLMNNGISYLGLIVTHTGGGSTALDGIDTTRITKPYLIDVYLPISTGEKQNQRWLARTRVDGENETAPGTNPEDFKFVVPDNYHATTNNVILERIA